MEIQRTMADVEMVDGDDALGEERSLCFRGLTFSQLKSRFSSTSFATTTFNNDSRCDQPVRVDGHAQPLLASLSGG
eukprot:764873-Hanusia_phi.AAC.2